MTEIKNVEGWIWGKLRFFFEIVTIVLTLTRMLNIFVFYLFSPHFSYFETLFRGDLQLKAGKPTVDERQRSL